ncbi:HEAT repeat domain-containing protein [Paractinoplanes rishiriensis]|uniref:TIR domain-containing protein n=1 Tax=Paractinoplanes rishiriensis TaxID=1050105 RepID=A0A919JXF7_9ACTN|nr:HEAT repeat domain-containing protein [Actinoplanes rishiriensis]GIE92741.1 hypothetical protein Ari01nite_02060 [Actinoplanes rishiriensis]
MTKVYLSATYSDLVECRAALALALRRLGLEDVSAGASLAEERRPLAKCLAGVGESDICVVVVAWRYGYVPPGSDRSITELEYREAVRLGKPVLVFLLDEDAPWPRSFMDTGPAAAQVEAFRAGLEERHPCVTFRGPGDLGTAVTADLTRFLASTGQPVGGLGTLAPDTLRRYYTMLRVGNLNLDLDALTPADFLQVRLESVFVEPAVRAGPPGPERELFEVVADPAHRRLVLLGDPGAGKSTAVRALVIALARTGRPADDRLAALDGHLPTLIPLRELSGQDVLDYLDVRGLHRDDLLEYLNRGGPAVAFFDGLDEIADLDLRARTADRIDTFAEQFPQVRVIVTSRAAGYRPLAGFEHFTIQRLDQRRSDELWDRWRRLGRSGPDLPPAAAGPDLAGNPLLLTVLAIMGQGRSRARGPALEQAADVLLDHWDATRHLGGTDPEPPVIAEFLAGLAVRIFPDDSIAPTDLVALAAAHLADRLSLDEPGSVVAAETMIRRLEERSFLLGRDDAENYRFTHRSFLEFFCARAVATWPLDRLTALYTDRWAIPAWHEVLRLVAGRLPERDAAAMLRLLADGAGQSWQPGPLDPPPGYLVLAVRCLGEVDRFESPEVRAAAQHVLGRIILLLEHCVAIDDPATVTLIEDELVPAVKACGAAWPRRRTYLEWYRRRGVRLRWDGVATPAARIAAILAKAADSVHELFADELRTGDPVAQRAAIAGLATLALRPRWTATDTHTHIRAPLLAHARGAEDATVRSAALVALALSFADDDPTKDALVWAAHHERAPVRVVALAVLSHSRVEPLIVQETLLEAVRDADPTVRLAAVVAAEGDAGAEPVRVALRERIQSDPSAAVVSAAVEALGPGDEDAGPLLQARVPGESDGSVRQVGVAFLADRAGSDFFRDRLKADEDEGVLGIAANALATRFGAADEVRDILLGRLRTDTAASSRLAVARTAAEVLPADAAVLEALGHTLRNDEAAEVRRGVLALIQHVPTLIGCAGTDPDEAVRAAAVTALGTADTDDRRTVELALVAAVSDTSPTVRAAAVTALGEQVLLAPTVLLLGRLGEADADAAVRAAATQVLVAHALGRPELGRINTGLAAETVQEVLADLVRGPQTDEHFGARLVDRVRVAADPAVIEALALTYVDAFGPVAPMRAALLERTKDPGSRIRVTAVRLLGRRYTEDAEARQVLIDAVMDGDQAVRVAAAQALCRAATADHDILALVRELAANAPDPLVRAISGQALTWLPDADPARLPDLPVPEPELAEPAAEEPVEDDLPQVILKIDSVFRRNGPPVHTFVEPPDYDLLRMALRQPGLGIVIEGPTGIGKTSLVHACLEELRDEGYRVEELSARDPRHRPRLLEILGGDHDGTVAVDDFHRLPAELRGRVADYLKLLADRGDEDRKLLIVGIPDTGRNLVRFGHDLGTRIQIFQLPKVDDDLVLQMIRRGEKALNVTFEQAGQIVRQAAGSLNVAQILCLHIAQLSRIDRTAEQHMVITDGIDRAMQYLDRALHATYQDVVHLFCRLDGDKRRTCVDLLLRLAGTDGVLALDDVQREDPAVARDIRTAILEPFPNGFEGPVGDVLRQHLFLDPHSRQLVVENPLLLFYLRQRERTALVRATGKRDEAPRSQIFISYSHEDADLLARLLRHMTPLESRGLLDVWVDTKLNPGDRWRDEIESALDRAQVAILVVSASFLASKFITEVELPRLLAASRSDGCRVWPLIAGHSVIAEIPELAGFQAFNKPSEPLTSLSEDERERVLSRLATETLREFASS